jgi:protein-L-isoaspartate(D-aspartate) O-methyltransferase
MKPMNEEHLAVLRRHMVEMIAILADLSSEEIGKATLDERVMASMRRVPRHLFVPASVAPYAYQDMPLPIGFDKTISQPFMVALMTDLLAPRRHESVLEIGTGLGYQTAILAELAGQVWSVEIIEEFASQAEALLQGLGISNVAIRVGDGSRGWPEHAPFDKILVSVAAERTPPALLKQLKPGGRMVLPLASEQGQFLTVIDKDAAGQLKTRKLIPVRFSRLETV